MPCSASSAACSPSREAWPACRRLMSAPPLTKANSPAALDAAIPSALASATGREPAQLAGRHRRPEHADRGGRMEAALAQVGMTGPSDGDVRLVAGDDRLDQRLAADAAVVAERQHRRHHHAAGMHRALPVAVVELDAVGGGAAKEGGVDEIGAPRAAGHRDAAGRPHRRQHRLGAACDLAARAGDHDADGVEQVATRVVPRFLRNAAVAERAHERHDGIGCAGGGMEGLQRFGVRHGVSDRRSVRRAES